MEQKSIVILGTAPSRVQAPFEDDSHTIWGVSTTASYPDVKRVDRLFELHPRRYWGIPQITDDLRKFNGEVVMQDHYDEIPNSVAYPREAVRERFMLSSMDGKLYCTNTITWMLLCAMHEGFTDFSLFGVHMAHDTEYGYQQPSVSWAVGIIHGYMLAGLPYSLTIADESELLRARYEYGFEEPTQDIMELDRRIEGLRKGASDGEREKADLDRRIMKTEGAMEEAIRMRKWIAGQR